MFLQGGLGRTPVTHQKTLLKCLGPIIADFERAFVRLRDVSKGGFSGGRVARNGWVRETPRQGQRLLTSVGRRVPCRPARLLMTSTKQSLTESSLRVFFNFNAERTSMRPVPPTATDQIHVGVP